MSENIKKLSQLKLLSDTPTTEYVNSKANQKDVNDLSTSLFGSDSEIINIYKISDLTHQYGVVLATNGTIMSNSTATQWRYSDYIEISSDMNVEFYITDNLDANNWGIAFYDEMKTFLSGIVYKHYNNFKANLPPRTKFFRYSSNNDSRTLEIRTKYKFSNDSFNNRLTIAESKLSSNENRLSTVEVKVEDISQNISNPFRGKIFSFLGDSITAKAGWIPVEDGWNIEHRPQYNSSMPVESMWWHRVISKLEGKLGICDASDGTTVCNSSTVDSSDYKTGPRAYIGSSYRITNLESNGTPDIIVIFGGTNDARSGRATTMFDQAIATLPMTEQQYLLNVFSGDDLQLAKSYFYMIRKVQYKYPKAKVVCMGPFYSYNDGFGLSSKQVSNSNKIIEEICRYLGTLYINTIEAGFYVGACIALQKDTLHPNKLGQETLGDYVANKIKNNVFVYEGENVVFPVTRNLTYLSTSKPQVVGISKGTSYTETISGVNITGIIVKMSGVDITSTSYNTTTGIISIASVTGPVDITNTHIIQTYNITNSLSNITASSTNPTTITEGETVTLKYTSESPYILPSDVTVTNATKVSWDQPTGTLVINNPTGNVGIQIEAILVPVYSIATSLSNITASSTNPTTIQQGSSSTLTFTANFGYILPSDVTVTNATKVSWDQPTGTLVINNPTNNVTIEINGVAVQVYNITNGTLTHVTADSSNPTKIQQDTEVQLKYTVETGYEISTVEVSGAIKVSFVNNILTINNPTSDVTINVIATAQSLMYFNYADSLLGIATFKYKTQPGYTCFIPSVQEKIEGQTINCVRLIPADVGFIDFYKVSNMDNITSARIQGFQSSPKEPVATIEITSADAQTAADTAKTFKFKNNITLNANEGLCIRPRQGNEVDPSKVTVGSWFVSANGSYSQGAKAAVLKKTSPDAQQFYEENWGIGIGYGFIPD